MMPCRESLGNSTVVRTRSTAVRVRFAHVDEGEGFSVRCFQVAQHFRCSPWRVEYGLLPLLCRGLADCPMRIVDIALHYK